MIILYIQLLDAEVDLELFQEEEKNQHISKKGIIHYSFIIFNYLFVCLHNQYNNNAIIEYKINRTEIFKRKERAFYSSPPIRSATFSTRFLNNINVK